MRVDRLEEEKADKEDVQRRLDEISAKLDLHDLRSRGLSERVFGKVDDINQRLARIEGSLNQLRMRD